MEDSTSFNNTTTSPLNQQPPSEDIQAEPAMLTVTIVPETPQTQLVSATITTSGNTTEENHAQNDSEHIAKQVQSISIAIMTGSCTLLGNPPEDVHYPHVLHRMFLLSLLLSFGSTALLFYISKTTPSPGGAWLQKKILRVAILSFIISVTLKVFSLLSTPMEWYDVLVPLLLLGASSPYLWYGWIKANNSGQTSSPPITTPVEDIWKSIAKKVQPISIAVGVGSLTLLTNPPRYEHNRRVQYKLFLLFLLFSFGSIAALVYIPKTTPSPGGAWLQKQALKTAIVSFVISVILRIFFLLTPIEWYDVLIPIVVVAVNSLYLWYGWKKANNSAQASKPEALATTPATPQKSIAKKVQPISIAVGAGSYTLLANPPKYEHNLCVQYRLFLLFLLFSFWSTAALVYIPKTRPSPGDAWLQKQALKTAIVSFIISVTLRIFFLLTPIEWYDVLIPFVVVAVSSLYLWYGWEKANNLAQASNPAALATPAAPRNSFLCMLLHIIFGFSDQVEDGQDFIYQMTTKDTGAIIWKLLLITQFIIWRERCNRIFKQQSKSEDQLKQEITNQWRSSI